MKVHFSGKAFSEAVKSLKNCRADGIGIGDIYTKLCLRVSVDGTACLYAVNGYTMCRRFLRWTAAEEDRPIKEEHIIMDYHDPERKALVATVEADEQWVIVSYDQIKTFRFPVWDRDKEKNFRSRMVQEHQVIKPETTDTFSFVIDYNLLKKAVDCLKGTERCVRVALDLSKPMQIMMDSDEQSVLLLTMMYRGDGWGKKFEERGDIDRGVIKE